MKPYADSNFLVRLLYEFPESDAAERAISDLAGAGGLLPITWLHRVETLNALHLHVWQSRQPGQVAFGDVGVDRQARQVRADQVDHGGDDHERRHADQGPALALQIGPQPAQGGGRVLATTLTKRMAEDLSAYLKDRKIKAESLHSDIKTIERIQIITKFRKGEFDILVGVNLLREGLDLPEVSLVTILDADKEGFLRSATALIQTIGRAARHPQGQVIMYADKITGSMQQALDETARRRAIQQEYNTKHGIVPQLMQKPIKVTLPSSAAQDAEARAGAFKQMGAREKSAYLDELKEQMRMAALQLDYERAAELRDEIKALQS